MIMVMIIKMTMTMRMTMTMKNIQFRTLKSQINKKKIFLLTWQTNIYVKMSYDWFNRQEILQKAKERHSKEKLKNIIYKTMKL